jgi:hypothetical protein
MSTLKKYMNMSASECEKELGSLSPAELILHFQKTIIEATSEFQSLRLNPNQEMTKAQIDKLFDEAEKPRTRTRKRSGNSSVA